MYLRVVSPPLRLTTRSLQVFIVIPPHTIMDRSPKGQFHALYLTKRSPVLLQILTSLSLPDRTNLPEVASLSVLFQIQIFFNDVLWTI
jgi:hypothetical protein